MKLNKDVFLRGESISLRPLREEDIYGNYKVWLNDPEITEFNSHGRFPMTPEKLCAFVQRIGASNNTDLVMAILENEQFAHIGNISLQNIHWIDRSAEIAFILGERAFWGKGVMYEAGKLMITHGFKMLNLHRIYCGTAQENTGMRRLADKLGFSEEGVRLDAIFKNGRYSNIVEYGLLSDIK